MANEYVAMAYDSVNPAKAERMRGCASFMAFVDDKSNGRMKLKDANFCRVRLCPMCTWRRSLKVAGQVQKIMTAIAGSDEPLRYVFLTLTVRNCSADKLSETITGILEAFNRFNAQLPFKRVVVGWYRALEITHNLDENSDSYDTFHPHFHVVLGVKPGYFKSRNYLSQARFAEMWQQAMRTDYAPRVDVRSVKGETAKAVAEAAKYSVKAADIIIPDDWDLTVETLRILDTALDRRRLIAFGGRFKEIHAALKLDDAEKGDLVHTTDNADGDSGEHVYQYAWHSGYRQYVRVRE